MDEIKSERELFEIISLMVEQYVISQGKDNFKKSSIEVIIALCRVLTTHLFALKESTDSSSEELFNITLRTLARLMDKEEKEMNSEIKETLTDILNEYPFLKKIAGEKGKMGIFPIHKKDFEKTSAKSFPKLSSFLIMEVSKTLKAEGYLMQEPAIGRIVFDRSREDEKKINSITLQISFGLLKDKKEEKDGNISGESSRRNFDDSR